jgi:hypothetical protein
MTTAASLAREKGMDMAALPTQSTSWAGLRRQLQLAAEQAWLWCIPGVATIRNVAAILAALRQRRA